MEIFLHVDWIAAVSAEFLLLMSYMVLSFIHLLKSSGIRVLHDLEGRQQPDDLTFCFVMLVILI